jgi:hypothetical protein
MGTTLVGRARELERVTAWLERRWSVAAGTPSLLCVSGEAGVGKSAVVRAALAEFATPEELRDFFKACYGPTIAAYRANADSPERTAALDEDLAALGRRFELGSPGATMLEWEYLLVTARKA